MHSRRDTHARPETESDRQADLKLVRAVLDNQPQAIEALSARLQFVPRILSAHNARLGFPLDEHELADVVQDAIIVLWRKLDAYAARSRFEGWVYRVCVLEFMNGLKKKQRRRNLHCNLDAAEGSRSEAEVPMWEYEELHLGLDRLAADESTVIRLKHFEFLTLDQVAERLQLAPSTVRTRYYRGIAWLEQFLRTRREGGGG